MYLVVIYFSSAPTGTSLQLAYLNLIYNRSYIRTLTMVAHGGEAHAHSSQSRLIFFLLIYYQSWHKTGLAN